MHAFKTGENGQAEALIESESLRQSQDLRFDLLPDALPTRARRAPPILARPHDWLKTRRGSEN
jgi:hypothetical protein